jgi:hypothetical protein
MTYRSLIYVGRCDGDSQVMEFEGVGDFLLPFMRFPVSYNSKFVLNVDRNPCDGE